MSYVKDPMLQRCFDHDYHERCIYMLTLTIEGQKPLLGTLEGHGAEAHIVPTALGGEVDKAVLEIPQYYPQIEVLERQVMPDHLHMVLFVTERLPVPLGEVLTGFKLGTSRCWWRQLESQGLLAPKEDKSAPPNGAQQDLCASPNETQPDKSGCTAVRPQYLYPKPPRLWEAGFHDRILLRKGQLETMRAYVRDNPRRLAAKRDNPQLFTITHNLQAGGRTYSAIGNRYLLQAPDRLQVQCSRRITPEELAQQQAELLAAARHGAVLISPCISPGEKQIATTALEQHLPLVVLLENGFAPLYKPSGRYFDACQSGLLLMLAPWPHHTDKRAITRQQCLQLNAMAKELCL